MTFVWILPSFAEGNKDATMGVGAGCLFILGTCLIWTLYQRYVSDLSDIPGPFMASITRFWHVCVILQGKQNLRIKALHEKHGPFVRIAPNEASVCHPDGSTQLLRKSHEKGDWYRVTAVPDVRFQNPMSTTDPDRKNGLSKHFAAAYSPKYVGEYMPGIDRNINDFLQTLKRDAKTKRPMNLDEYITRLTFENVCWALFSKTFGLVEEGRDVGGVLRNNVALSKFAAVAGFYIGILRVIVNPLTSWILVLPMGKLYSTTACALKERLRSECSHRDMLEYWKKSGTLTLRQIEAQANVNVGAGAEPVSSAIQSIVYHLIRNPDALRRAREEIDTCPLDRVMAFEEVSRMTYFQACIKEALRMFSPTTMSLPRVAPKEGITIGRRHFKGGTTLSVSSHAVHASKEIWGPDAAQYRPERWLTDDKVKKEFQERNWLVMAKVAALILRNFQISLADPDSPLDYQANFTALLHSWPVYMEERAFIQAKH